jgi:hypothetical protein
MGLLAVVARVLAWRKHTTPEDVADCFFRGGNYWALELFLSVLTVGLVEMFYEFPIFISIRFLHRQQFRKFSRSPNLLPVTNLARRTAGINPARHMLG